jgi:hypothetical protein
MMAEGMRRKGMNITLHLIKGYEVECIFIIQTLKSGLRDVSDRKLM